MKARDVAVIGLTILLLLAAGLSLAAGDGMSFCPECLAASAFTGVALCLVVLAGGVLFGTNPIGRIHTSPRLRHSAYIASSLFRPPRPA